jgi:hypothetical protein
VATIPKNPFEEDTEDSFIRGHVQRECDKPGFKPDFKLAARSQFSDVLPPSHRDKLDELEQMALDALDEI